MKHPTVSVNEQESTDDNVHVTLHDVADLREQYPQWDTLSKKEKMRLARDVDPVERTSTHNTTQEGFHNHLADVFNPQQSVVLEDCSHLGVGNDSSTSPSTSNSSLNNEVARAVVTEGSRGGTGVLQTSTFLDVSQANGYTLSEVGLFSDSADDTSETVMHNHALLSNTITKTDTNTATIDVSITFGN